MTIELQIETSDIGIGFSMVGQGEALGDGTVIEAPGGFTLTCQGILLRRAVDVPSVLNFIVDAAETINLGLFSAWLYNKVEGKPVRRIVINQKEVLEITEEGIRKELSKTIEVVE